ncbi:MAG: GNAT family N-acetyltransferase [Acidocella sp.]|nr:GNAT family N-acetyltransferase [Acidocella sp.]
MIAVRRARVNDAPGIASVHVLTWRSAYAAILPEATLTKLSFTRLTSQYDRMIRMGRAVFVAANVNPFATPTVLGFATARRANDDALGQGEVETLYVLDDWQNRGLGGELLRIAAKYLVSNGANSAYAWVLRDNPAAYFYQRLGAKCVAHSTTSVGGSEIPQSAYAWDPIETLLDVNAR